MAAAKDHQRECSNGLCLSKPTQGSEDPSEGEGISMSKEALLAVLDRAADDYDFIAQLTYEGSKALKDYDLTREEKAALLSGDINWIERQVGKLDERMSTWLKLRLQQEIW